MAELKGSQRDDDSIGIVAPRRVEYGFVGEIELALVVPKRSNRWQKVEVRR